MGGVIEAHMHSDSQGCIEYRHRHSFVSVTVVVQPKSCCTDIRFHLHEHILGVLCMNFVIV